MTTRTSTTHAGSHLIVSGRSWIGTLGSPPFSIRLPAAGHPRSCAPIIDSRGCWRPKHRTGGTKDVLATALLRAAEQAGVTLSEPQARALPDSWATLPIFDDTEPMLADLRAMGCRLAVLTNCDEALFEQTHRSFRQRFDAVVTAERVSAYKPSLTHFRFFAQSSGVAGSDWVHVACSWYHDIAPARELGIKRVWLDRDQTGQDAKTASAYVRSAAEVRGGVAALYGNPD